MNCHAGSCDNSKTMHGILTARGETGWGESEGGEGFFPLGETPGYAGNFDNNR